MATKKILTNIDSDGTIESTSFIKTGGTSSQFLKADGSVDGTAYGTGTVDGTGTENCVPKWKSGGAGLEDSSFKETATSALIEKDEIILGTDATAIDRLKLVLSPTQVTIFPGNTAKKTALVHENNEVTTYFGENGLGISVADPDAPIHIYENIDGEPTKVILENGDTTITSGQQVTVLDFQANDASTNGAGSMGQLAMVAENAGNVYGMALYTKDGTPGTNEVMRLSGDGNVGIGTTDPSEKLEVDGNILTSGGVSNENAGVRVTNPGGGAFVTTNASMTGAIKIVLPQDGPNSMLRMTVKVYEYLTNESFILNCGGYATASGSWVNEFAYIENSGVVDRNFTVRFGNDGSNACIYVGELNSTWSYIQVFVTDFQAGYGSATAALWQDGWDIEFEATAFDSVTKTVTNTQTNNWVRDGINTHFNFTTGTGNVGIGTDSTGAKLDIVTNNAAQIPIRITHNAFNDWIIQKRRSDNSQLMGLKELNSNGSLGLVTNNSVRMTVNNAGDVGIGTTSPNAISTTVGTLSLGGTNTGTSGGISFQVNGTVKAYNYVTSSYLINQTVTGVGQIFYGAGLERMRIDKTGGNIGIGTTGVGHTKLHVAGGSTAAPTLGSTGNGSLAVTGGVTSYGFTMGVYGTGQSYIQSQRFDSTSTVYDLLLQPVGGRVLIGTKHLFETDGDAHHDGDVIAYSTSVSDRRRKDNIKTIDNATETVKQLRGVSYEWNKGHRKGQKEIGVIAQEVEKVLPFLVREKTLLDGDSVKTVDYEKIIGLLIEDSKSKDARIEKLETMVELILKDK
tara:strand:+ start:614 stop:2995 length:2382 start_codon:yes stop_codon:yes gene_type:complete